MARATVSTPSLSVVIPTLDEAGHLRLLLDDLRQLGSDCEVLVADGGSTDGTRDIAMATGARVVEAARGRGSQLRAGVEASTAPTVLILHADVRLPAAAARAVSDHVARGAVGLVAFRLRIDGGGWAYRVVELAANLRARVLGLPYGDQGLLLPRDAYDAAGGYAEVPLMEDVMLVRALRRTGHAVALSPECVVASARRWRRDGVWRRSLSNMLLLVRWRFGASPDSLARRYERPP